MSSRKIIVSGATSGIGREIALQYIEAGCMVGVMGRRRELLVELQQLKPTHVFVQTVDVTSDEATTELDSLIAQMGGMDVYVHVSGVGSQNVALDLAVELHIVNTNGMGYTRMLTAAFNHFAAQGRGHIAAVTSIAGTKGLGASPSYSATKRYQNHYIDSLAQLAHMRKLNIQFTDIRPGFVDTALLKNGKFPMLMKVDRVGKIAFNAIQKRKRVKIIDGRYAVVVFFWRLIPRFIWERLSIKN